MADKVLSTPTVQINNTAIYIVPNSFKYDEGGGEQTVRTQSGGGGSIEIVSSDNAESKMTKFSFSLLPTQTNIDLARSWKKNLDQNAMGVSEGNFSRSVNNATLTNNYEVPLDSESTIDLEFMGTQAV